MVELFLATTWTDVFDDAVKIGLGTVIGIVGSLMVLARTHAQELVKEKRQRRQDALERIVEEFERVQATFMELYGVFGAFLLQSGNPTVIRTQTEKVFTLREELLPALQNLHGIEGRLMLFKLNGCAEAVAKYRLAATNLQNNISTTAPLPNLADVEKKMDDVRVKRRKFYELISAAYV